MENNLTEKQKHDSNFILIMTILIVLVTPNYLALPFLLGLQIYFIRKEEIYKLQRIWLVSFIYSLIYIFFLGIGVSLIILLVQVDVFFTFLSTIVMFALAATVAIISWKYRKPSKTKPNHDSS